MVVGTFLSVETDSSFYDVVIEDKERILVAIERDVKTMIHLRSVDGDPIYIRPSSIISVAISSPGGRKRNEEHIAALQKEGELEPWQN